MPDGYNKIEDQHTDFVEELLRLPARNLETGITELEKAVIERQQISWDALSVLGTEKLRLEDRLIRMRYSVLAGGSNQAETTTKRNHLNLDQTVIQEQVNCFNDVQRLKDQLRQAKEELAMEQPKFRLFRSGVKIS